MRYFSCNPCLIIVICLVINVLPCWGQLLSYIPGANYLFGEYERCNDKWIPGNMYEFQSTFRRNVYGQPLVESTIASAVTAHMKGNTRKALTLSFHGWPGGGKNYVTSFLVKAIYKNGIKSSFYKYYNSRTDFTQQNDISKYQKKLREEIREYLSRCPRSLFVFDEIDMMPYKLLDTVHPYLDYHEIVDGVDARQAIFIFLSNSGGNEISELMLQYWKKGLLREDLKVGHFQNVVRLAAFNDLEKSHVRQCIESEYARKNVAQPTEVQIESILSLITFTRKDSATAGLFSVSGCKNIDTLVSTAIETEQMKEQFEL